MPPARPVHVVEAFRFVEASLDESATNEQVHLCSIRPRTYR